MRSTLAIASLGMAALLSGCMAAGPRTGPVEVSRFHLGQPVARESVSIEPLTGFAGASPEDKLWGDAVAGELNRLGFVPTSTAPSTYIAAFSYTRSARGYVRHQSPFSIGIGAGGFSGGRSGGVGVGGDVSVPVGKGRTDAVIGTQLKVQLKRRSDMSIVWEGTAVTETIGNGPSTQSGPMAQRLAAALFKGFPGESGITITVK